MLYFNTNVGATLTRALRVASPPVTNRRNLVRVGRAGGHVGISEDQTAETLAEGLRGVAVVAGQGVGDTWGRGPVVSLHWRPREYDLRRVGRRRQGRVLPEAGSLTPATSPALVSINVRLERRVLASHSEVPEVRVPTLINAAEARGRLSIAETG